MFESHESYPASLIRSGYNNNNHNHRTYNDSDRIQRHDAVTRRAAGWKDNATLCRVAAAVLQLWLVSPWIQGGNDLWPPNSCYFQLEPKIPRESHFMSQVRLLRNISETALMADTGLNQDPFVTGSSESVCANLFTAL